MLKVENELTFLLLAQEFVAAADVLHQSPNSTLVFPHAAIYAACHAAELMLKSYLFKHGVRVDELKKIGHDLNELISNSRAVGLPIELQTKSLTGIADDYSAKRLEYFGIGANVASRIGALFGEVEALNAYLLGNVSDF